MRYNLANTNRFQVLFCTIQNAQHGIWPSVLGNVFKIVEIVVVLMAQCYEDGMVGLNASALAWIVFATLATMASDAVSPFAMERR